MSLLSSRVPPLPYPFPERRSELIAVLRRLDIRRVAAALAPLGLVTAALLLRTTLASRSGLWEDEAWRYYVALGSAQAMAAVQQSHASPVWAAEFRPTTSRIPEMARMLQDQTPYMPAWFIVTHVTFRLAGADAYDLVKMWNALLSAATIWIVWRWTSRMAGSSAGILAGLALTLSAWDMGVSLQVREYALVSLCVTGATWCLWGLLVHPRRLAWLGYAGFVGLGVLTHLDMWVVLATHAVYVVSATRLRSRPCRQAASAGFVGAFAVVPWFAFAGARQLAHLRNANIAFGDPYRGLAVAVARLCEVVRTLAYPGPAGLAQDVVAVIAIAALAAALIGRHRRSAALPATVVLGFVTVSFGLHVLAGNGQSLWPRYFALILPCAAVTAAAGAVALVGKAPPPSGRRILLPVAASLVLVVGALQVRSYRDADPPLDSHADWRVNAARLTTHVPDGALVIQSPGTADCLALMAHWTKATRHRGWHASDDVPVAEWVDESGGRPIWLVLTWRADRHLPAVLHAMESAGYHLQDALALDGGVATAWAPRHPRSEANSRRRSARPARAPRRAE